ncbi:MAG: hypothetical protein NTY96_02125 [Bacteroidetes bacterium]|nr:hypothetical protein [Bacteroidota bacterium]
MKKLNYHEYLAFLLLFAAYADQSLDKEEIIKILEYNTKDEYIQMKQLILTMNDQQRIDLILEYQKIFLLTNEKIDSALQEIEAVFLSDHKYHPIEKFYYSFLNKFFHRN